MYADSLWQKYFDFSPTESDAKRSSSGGQQRPDVYRRCTGNLLRDKIIMLNLICEVNLLAITYR